MIPPNIGIQYYTWFDLHHEGNNGTGWRVQQKDGTFLRPFMYPDKGEYAPVSSALFSAAQGVCYSSLDIDTARVHAEELSTLNVDFAILDLL